MSKLVMISSSERSMEVPQNVSLPCNEKIRKVSSTNLISKRSKDTQDRGPSRSIILPSSRPSKLSLDKKLSLETALPSFNADDLSSRQMYESLIRLKKNATEPFTFLNNILDEKQSNVHNPVKKAKPTEIDLQLATLTRRVQLNKSLLERTNERVKEINFLVECNMMAAARELNYDQKELGNVKVNNEEVTDNDTALNIACPGIKELKRTISVTKEMLTYVKKICNNEIEMEDLPEELLQHMSP